MSEEIINKINNSGLIQFELESLLHNEESASFDIRETLFMNQILKEKDFRDFIEKYDWSVFTNKNVAVHCSEDVVIQNWAFMILASKIKPFAKRIFFCKPNELTEQILLSKINSIDLNDLQNQRIVVKGCGEYNFSGEVYLKITEKLMPVCKSIMFGEPCSTVPVYKKKS